MNLTIDHHSREWRRRVGAQAWAALEHLALTAHPEEGGWTAPVGVRDVATGLGVTKDTAARAVRILTHAGLAHPTATVGANGRKRRGYRLSLPEGISLESDSGCTGTDGLVLAQAVAPKACEVADAGHQPNGRTRTESDAAAKPPDRESAQPTLFAPESISMVVP